MLSIVALLALGLVPGVYAALASRKLLRRLDDPLLPDLLLAHSRRVGTVVGSCIGVGIVFSRDLTPAFIVLAALSALAGGYPVRKRIFEETWSLWSYLSHSLRFWTGLLGSLSLVYFLPAVTIVSLSAGVALAALVALWAPFGTDVFRRLVRARPLDAPELDEPFSRVLMKATSERPALFEAEAPGGSWVNAFALPSVRRPGVLFTRGLLDALTPAETTAIFAHEVAHLEHHTRAKTARGILALYVLAAIALFLWGGSYAEATRSWAFLWPITLLGMSLVRVNRARSHETESDLRALQLCEDPESLVSALIKIHARLRLARRWDAAHESVSTHPSLARRIQAIRSAAGERPPATSAPDALHDLFVRGAASDEAVLFEREQMHWLRGIPEDGENVLARSRERKTYRYGELRDLRVRGSFDKQELVFRDASPRFTTMAVSSDDVATIESLLDRVDVQLAAALPRTGRTPRMETERLSAVVLVLAALLSSSFSIVALALLAIVRPARVTIVAASAAGLGWALWTVLRSNTEGELTLWRVALVLLVGAACLAFAWKRRGEGTDTTNDVGLAVGGLLLLVVLGAPEAIRSLFSSLPAMELHLWARTSSLVFTGLAGLFAVLVTRRRAPARIGAAPVLALAALFLFLGSRPFRERCASELFAVPGSRIPVRSARLEKLREASVPGRGYRLVLSPDGERFALGTVPSGDEYRYEYGMSYEVDYRVETADGRLDTVRAIALDYLDEDRLVVLGKDGGRSVLRVLSLPELESVSIVEDLPLLPGVELEVDAALGAFQLTGTDIDEVELVVVRGRVDSGPAEELRFPLGGDVPTLAAVSRDGVALTQRYEVPKALKAGNGVLPYWLLAGSNPRFIKELSLIRPGDERRSLGKTALDVYCFRGPISETRFFCSATDSERTGIWSFEPESDRWEPIGFLHGHSLGGEIARDGRVVLRPWDRAPVLVDVEGGRGLLLDGLDEEDYDLLVVRRSRLATVRTDSDRDETAVTLYTVE
jgi:heat shock protein HtpX